MSFLLSLGGKQKFLEQLVSCKDFHLLRDFLICSAGRGGGYSWALGEDRFCLMCSCIAHYLYDLGHIS